MPVDPLGQSTEPGDAGEHPAEAGRFRRRAARPGQHVVQVEFVAADHAPFEPRVLAQAAFDVTP
jgi:hypothetical protein